MRVLLAAAAILVALPQSPAPTPAPLPATDIYLVTLRDGLASMASATPAPMATARGYDNQPLFSADGQRVLFAANHDGKQTDVYQFTRENGRVAQLTSTPENENSPTFLPDGLGPAGGFSVVRTEPDRTQRLWRFDAAGGHPQVVLTDIKPVGYHAWVDADHVALYVLGQPATLQLARVGTGKADVVLNDIGRSLHRVPGTRSVSVVGREVPDTFWVEQVDVDTKAVLRLVKAVEGNDNHDMAWMPDGQTMLMSGGTKVWAWARGDQGWREVFDAAAHKLGKVSRLAVSPKGDTVAIVVDER